MSDPAFDRAVEAMQPELTADEVRKLLRYDQETGKLFWLVRSAIHVSPGDEAGYVEPNGYISVSIRKRAYKSHRLIWLMVTGDWPAACIDHINGVRADNRLVNLRQATKAQNNTNSMTPKTNTSGYKGVTWNKYSGKFLAQIRFKRKSYFLGYFTEAEEAHHAYVAAAERLFGEFARTS